MDDAKKYALPVVERLEIAVVIDILESLQAAAFIDRNGVVRPDIEHGADLIEDVINILTFWGLGPDEVRKAKGGDDD